jgi:DNA-directed RNA polymerase specialized sigma24 family protein
VNRRDQRFAELLAAHGPGLGRVVQSYARPADQDDLAQEISLALWTALSAPSAPWARSPPR